MELKTMKDLEKFINISKEGVSISLIADINSKQFSKKVIDIEEIKQLAIERIKKIRKNFKEGMAGQTEDYNFMDFFNIIEEDLMTNEEINKREHGEKGNN